MIFKVPADLTHIMLHLFKYLSHILEAVSEDVGFLFLPRCHLLKLFLNLRPQSGFIELNADMLIGLDKVKTYLGRPKVLPLLFGITSFLYGFDVLMNCSVGAYTVLVHSID